MNQLKILLKRLKSPTISLSILSQIFIILKIFKFDIDVSYLNTAAASIITLFVLTGFMSNTGNNTKANNDDISVCKSCKKSSPHVKIAGALVCTNCGAKDGQL